MPTITFKDDKCFREKNSKQRITVLLCANITGKKKNWKPLVIRERKNTRCFKASKPLKVKYYFYKKAWMILKYFEKWLYKLDKMLGEFCRKISLLTDNYSAHPPDCAPKHKGLFSFDQHNFKTYCHWITV